MSLELSITGLASAMQNLADAINAIAGKGQAVINFSAPQAPEEMSGKKPEAASAPPTVEAPVTAPAEKAASSAKPLDFAADIQPLFLKIVKEKGRDAAMALIEDLKPGAKRLSEAVTPDQYPAVLAKINAILGG